MFWLLYLRKQFCVISCGKYYPILSFQELEHTYRTISEGNKKEVGPMADVYIDFMTIFRNWSLQLAYHDHSWTLDC